MALTVKSGIQFSINDGTVTTFSTGNSAINSTLSIDQSFGGDIIVANGAVDQSISIQGIQNAQMIFIRAEAPMTIKLVSTGHDASSTPSLTLLEIVPSLISVKNVIAIYVTNTTGADARIIVSGAGATGS